MLLRVGAARVVGDLDRVVARTRAAQAGEVGTIVVGAQGAALNALLPSIIASLAQRAEGLRVDLRQLTSEEQAAGILSGTLDYRWMGAVLSAVVPDWTVAGVWSTIT